MSEVHPLDLATHLIVTDWNMGALLPSKPVQQKSSTTARLLGAISETISSASNDYGGAWLNPPATQHLVFLDGKLIGILNPFDNCRL
jgi:hypothetical protein